MKTPAQERCVLTREIVFRTPLLDRFLRQTPWNYNWLFSIPLLLFTLREIFAPLKSSLFRPSCPVSFPAQKVGDSPRLPSDCPSPVLRPACPLFFSLSHDRSCRRRSSPRTVSFRCVLGSSSFQLVTALLGRFPSASCSHFLLLGRIFRAECVSGKSLECPTVELILFCIGFPPSLHLMSLPPPSCQTPLRTSSRVKVRCPLSCFPSIRT